MFFKKTNYQRSNSILKVDFEPSPKSKLLAEHLLLANSDVEYRQYRAQLLVDKLSHYSGIEPVKVKISDTKQYHRKSGNRVVFKQYGYYNTQTKYIYIQNFTAVRGQPLASKSFLDTLLHEWLHHYDSLKLGLNSIHSAGFYQRLRDLKLKLDIK